MEKEQEKEYSIWREVDEFKSNKKNNHIEKVYARIKKIQTTFFH